MNAPYGPLSLPKLLGVPGEVNMVLGVSLMALMLRADCSHGASAVWGGEMALEVLLKATAAMWLALYAAIVTGAVRLLMLLLGAVPTLSYTKIVHGGFCLAALVLNAQTKTAG